MLIIFFTNIIIFKNLITFLFWPSFFDDLDKFNKLKAQIDKKREKTNVYNTASELNNDLLGTYLMNYVIYQMLKEVKQTPNMILLLQDL